MEHPDVDDLILLLRDLLLPLSEVERTVKLPQLSARRENVPEHSFSLGLTACALAASIAPELDRGLIAQYSLVHDVVERYAGDTSIWAPSEVLGSKISREKHAQRKIRSNFGNVFPWIANTIDAYERRVDPESRFVYALDKILPHILIIISNEHPVRPHYGRYAARISIARAKVATDPRISPYFEELLAIFDERPHFFADGVPQHGRVSNSRADSAGNDGSRR
ncbi:HD domain-containing protein [Nocardia sp. NPDC049149]|uniref:HD domain-containing protein n=1 Tax=Nocardia sp. NPDC049149 TaxID=3364315 RepID=UPI00371D7F0A